MFKVGQTVWSVHFNRDMQHDVEKGRVVEIKQGDVYVAFKRQYEGEDHRAVVKRKPSQLFTTKDDALLDAIKRQNEIVLKAMNHAISLALQVKQ